jgi:hypothetical protein
MNDFAAGPEYNCLQVQIVVLARSSLPLSQLCSAMSKNSSFLAKFLAQRRRTQRRDNYFSSSAPSAQISGLRVLVADFAAPSPGVFALIPNCFDSI